MKRTTIALGVAAAALMTTAMAATNGLVVPGDREQTAQNIIEVYCNEFVTQIEPLGTAALEGRGAPQTLIDIWHNTAPTGCPVVNG